MEQGRKVQIQQRRLVADGVVVLELVDASGAALPNWEPGAHLDLVLPSGLIRQYSLCGDPAACDRWRIAILREPNGSGGSACIHDDLFEGAVVEVIGPRNNFPLVGAEHYLFVAGGIGITPTLPMVATLDAAGADWHLLYGGRRRASMAFLEELAAYGEHVTICPEDESGLLDLQGALRNTPRDAAVYCCGPEPLLAALIRACEQDERAAPYFERFCAAPELPRDDGSQCGEEITFEVVLQRKGLTVEVPPGATILETLEDAGYRPVCSCCAGYCGSCETTVLEGVPDHRDEYLSEAERASSKKIMICVSRSRSPRLVLDL